MSKRSIAAMMMTAAVLLAVSILLPLPRTPVGSAPRLATVPISVAGDTLRVDGVPEEIAAFLEEGRSWRAARALRSYLAGQSNPDPELILLAARSEAEWGGWQAAREYLEGRDWLDDVWDGEGWYWLGRAREEAGDDEAALEAYDRYLELHRADDASLAATTELRRGLVLLALGRVDAGAEAIAATADRAPYLNDWLALLSAEAMAEAGDTARIRSAIANLPAEANMRQRGRLALVEGYEAAADSAGAMRVALSLRSEAESGSQRAELSTIAGRLALALDDHEEAREALSTAMDLAPGSSAGREAAMLMSGLDDLSTAERLTIAEIYDRHGNAARAAAGYRAVLATDYGTADRRNELRLALGSALFATGDYAGAEEAVKPLLDASPALARNALYLTGRAEYRRGNRARAFDLFRELADRFPGSTVGSEGLFLVGDLSHDDGEVGTAASVYRRVADEFHGSDRAGLSLMRLAGIRYLAGDYADAAKTWEEYRTSYPRGQRWAQSSYWAGKSYEQLGDTARADELFKAVREREPLSYYALLSAEHLGVPYWPVPMVAAPPEDAAASRRVADLVRGLDLLRDAGLYSEADAEAQRLADRSGESTAVRYALAEALNERGYAIRGIRIGQDLERSASGMNPRLLKILYPLPYRSLLEAEAREQGLDPFVVAALTRQESLFTTRISSPVGARGLMQIMPETGQVLAKGIGIDEWSPDLLYNPEINVHLGTVYLAEQMDRYDESLPSVFSAYNAGPNRIDVWRDFPEFGDEELFTERIPYRETRDYVKILTRNIALYRGLYGNGDN